MKRQITGLHAADRCAADQIPDGVFLVRVQRVQFRRQAQKPYYTLALSILEPDRFAALDISSRLYCSPKALWKLNWFLRDFGYDTELMRRDEVDENQLIGLKGVVKITHIVVNPLQGRGLDAPRTMTTSRALRCAEFFRRLLQENPHDRQCKSQARIAAHGKL